MSTSKNYLLRSKILLKSYTFNLLVEIYLLLGHNELLVIYKYLTIMDISNNDDDKLITPKEIETPGAPKSTSDESKIKKEDTKNIQASEDKNNFQNYLIGFILIAIVVGIFVYASTTSISPISHEERVENEIAESEAQLGLELAASTDDSVSTIPEARQELSVEDSGVIQSNFLNSPTTLLIILSLLTLISISISFWLYYWRKLSIAGKEIMVPEKFEMNIKSLNKSAKEGTSIIQNALNNQIAALNSSRTISDNTNEEISRISEIIAHLQKSIEKKEDEMERFKKGYDADIYHKFLLRFTRVDRVLKEYIDDGSIDLDGLEDIHTQMEDALLECRVESFSPEVGVDYKTQDNIADNPKKTLTTDKEQHEKVEKVLQVGYFRVCEDDSIEIISQAKVVIFYYEKPEVMDEPTNRNNIKE